jgi:hypothetical protein
MIDEWGELGMGILLIGCIGIIIIGLPHAINSLIQLVIPFISWDGLKTLLISMGITFFLGIVWNWITLRYNLDNIDIQSEVK